MQGIDWASSRALWWMACAMRTALGSCGSRASNAGGIMIELRRCLVVSNPSMECPVYVNELVKCNGVK